MHPTPDDVKERGGDESAVAHPLLIGSSTGAGTRSITPKTPSLTTSTKKSRRRSSAQVANPSKSHMDDLTLQRCQICLTSVHDVDQCTLLKEGSIECLHSRLTGLEQIAQSLSDDNAETSITLLMAAIAARATQENLESPAASDAHKVSAPSNCGNPHTSDIPTATSAISAGESMAHDKEEIDQATQTPRATSETAPVLGDIFESPSRPERQAAAPLVVDSSQEREAFLRNHSVLSRHPRQEAEPSLTALGQMPESQVTEYFGDRAFSEALSEDNRFEKRMMGGPETATSNCENDEAANEYAVEKFSDRTASRMLHHPKTPERSLSHKQSLLSRRSSQLGLALSQRQYRTPKSEGKRGRVLVPNSQPSHQLISEHTSKAPSRRSRPCSQEEFAEVETPPVVGENLTSGSASSPEGHRGVSLDRAHRGQETPQKENVNERISAQFGSTLRATLHVKTAAEVQSDDSQEGENSRDATPTADELEFVNDDDTSRSFAQRTGDTHLTDQANGILKNSDNLDRTEPIPSIGKASEKPKGSPNGSSSDEVFVDSSLHVNRAPGSPPARSIGNHPSSVTKSPSRGANRRGPSLFLSSPPRTQQSTTVPSSTDRLPPRMRPANASQQPPISRWPSLMSLTTDQVRHAVQSRRSTSSLAMNPRSSSNFDIPFDANSEEDTEESEDDDSNDDRKIVSSQIPPGRRAGSNLNPEGLMERTTKLWGKEPRKLFST